MKKKVFLKFISSEDKTHGPCPVDLYLSSLMLSLEICIIQVIFLLYIEVVSYYTMQSS